MTSSTADNKDITRKCCRISGDSEILRHSPLFSGINPEVIKLLAYLSTRRFFKNGDYLIEQGKKAGEAFLLIDGEVDITVHHRGHEIVLQQVEKNRVIGELSLLAQFLWFFNARASGMVEVLIIDKTAFQKVLDTFPEHKDKLIERIIQLRVDRLVEQTTFMLDKLLNSKGKLKTAI